MENRFYEDVPIHTSDEVAEILLRADVDQLRLVAIELSLYHDEKDLVLATCLELSRHADEFVRGNAILSFGYCAWRFGQLDESIVKPIIEAAFLDESDHVRGHAWSAADDTEHFLGWRVARPDNA